MRRSLIVLAICLSFALFSAAQNSAPAASNPPSPEVRVLQQPIKVEPPSPTASVEELEASADKLREQNMYRDAVDYYDSALKKDQKNAVLWNKRGIALLQMGRYAEGAKSFEKAIKNDKKYPDAYNNLGVIYYKEEATKAANKDKHKDFGRAIKNYRKAIKLRDESASFHSNLGTALFGQGDFKAASNEYKRALQLDPDIFERSSRIGVSAHLSSPEDRAHFAYEIAKEYAQAGNLDRALYYLRRALEDGYAKVNDAFKDAEFVNVRKDPRFTELMSANRPVSVTVPE